LLLEAVMAKRHVGFDGEIIGELSRQEKTVVENKSSNESMKLHNWSRQVGCSIHRTEMFTRLNINEKGILFARIDPEHHVEDIVVDFFTERFPMFIVVLESRRGCFVKKKGQQLTIVKNRMENVIRKLESDLEGNDILCDLLDFDDKMIWNVFYNSANIPARKNSRYFLHNVPKKFHDLPGLEEERRAFDGNQSLLAFE